VEIVDIKRNITLGVENITDRYYNTAKIRSNTTKTIENKK
jgi:hypothetical protein